MRSGGKERRLLELVYYLKFQHNYELIIVLSSDEIHYEYVKQWEVPIYIIQRKGLKKDPSVFIRFYKICQKFLPDIIHTWGSMNTFYAIPSKMVLRKKLITSMISNANNEIRPWSLDMFFFKLNCYFSDYILSNSYAGIEAYNVTSRKARVIYNGIRLERFEEKFDRDLIRQKHGITTTFMIIMVASVNNNKDYDLFLNVAKIISTKRSDVTFVSVGYGSEFDRIENRIRDEKINNVLMLNVQRNVEAIIFASDIGILLSPIEGISNSILEYMALCKPVITNSLGGSSEVVENGQSGYLLLNSSDILISEKIEYLLDNEDLRILMGRRGKSIIKTKFNIEKISLQFISLYENIKMDN